MTGSQRRICHGETNTVSLNDCRRTPSRSSESSLGDQRRGALNMFIMKDESGTAFNVDFDQLSYRRGIYGTERFTKLAQETEGGPKIWRERPELVKLEPHQTNHGVSSALIVIKAISDVVSLTGVNWVVSK